MVEIDFVTVLMKMVFPNALVDFEFYMLANIMFLKFCYNCRKTKKFPKMFCIDWKYEIYLFRDAKAIFKTLVSIYNGTFSETSVQKPLTT